MKRIFLLALIPLLAAGCAGMRTSKSWTKEEIVRWYAEGRGTIRFVGYQGSDQVQHHFIARVFDSWTFFQISKAELRLPDERPFASASSAQLYFYVVDLAREFEKVEPRKRANKAPEPTTMAVTPRATS
jgi:hypothetical protein